MSVVDGGSSSGLVQRVQDILMRPGPTWEKIDGEAATVRGLYTGYVCILAAIPAVCGVIGSLTFRHVVFAPLGLVGAVIGYGLTLLGVYVMALVIDALAPSFGGQKNPVQAFKVSAYSGTAMWLAGVFQIVPMLSPLAIVGLYSLYLLYRGLPKLMKVSDDKAIGYTAVVIVAMLAIYLVIGLVMGSMALVGLGTAAIGMGGMMR